MSSVPMSNYAKRMARLSARIFGEVARPTNTKSMKVVKLFSEKPVDLRGSIINWYPPHPQITKLMLCLREHGLFRDEHEDFKEEMQRQRRLRGKRMFREEQKAKAKKNSSSPS